MKDFSELTKFLATLPREQEKMGQWVLAEGQLPFVSYGEAVYPLRDAIAALPEQHPDMNLYEYQAILEEKGLKGVALDTVAVTQLDARTVAAMLVAVWREERFSDGLLLSYLEKGCIQRWLERLQALEEQ